MEESNGGDDFVFVDDEFEMVDHSRHGSEEVISIVPESSPPTHVETASSAQLLSSQIELIPEESGEQTSVGCRHVESPPSDISTVPSKVPRPYISSLCISTQVGNYGRRRTVEIPANTPLTLHRIEPIIRESLCAAGDLKAGAHASLCILDPSGSLLTLTDAFQLKPGIQVVLKVADCLSLELVHRESPTSVKGIELDVGHADAWEELLRAVWSFLAIPFDTSIELVTEDTGIEIKNVSQLKDLQRISVATTNVDAPSYKPVSATNKFSPGMASVRAELLSMGFSASRLSMVLGSKESMTVQEALDTMLSASDSPPVPKKQATSLEVLLVAMGFESDEVHALVMEHGPSLAKEEAVELLLKRTSNNRSGSVSSMKNVLGTCQICMEDNVSLTTVGCKEAHKFCVNCLLKHAETQLLDASLLPTCPLANIGTPQTRCSHEIGSEELDVLMRSSGTIEPALSTRMREAHKNILMRRGLRATGAVPCVNPSCGNWMLESKGGSSRVECPSCAIVFCSACSRTPFHYGCACQEVMRLEAAWLDWVEGGRTRHLQLLGQHEDTLIASQKEIQALRSRHEENKAMERWKVERCRLCPTCKRVIERISGCSSMVCGVDAHGGNTQNGCGAHFDWESAEHYKADLCENTEAVPTNLSDRAANAAAAVSASQMHHYVTDGVPLRCDRCHGPVRGLLFRCIACREFACCMRCQPYVVRDPRHAHHTFRIVVPKASEQDTTT